MFHRKQLFRVLMWPALVVLLGSAGYFALFRGEQSFLACLYMTVISLTTVGYGEVVPVTGSVPAVIYTMVLIVFGMGILVYAAGTFTAFIVEGHFSGFIRRKRMQQQIDRMNRHFIVCGLGDTGVRALEELLKNRNEVVAVDLDEERLRNVEEIYREEHEDTSAGKAVFRYVRGDATDDHVLTQAGVQRASGLISVLPSDKDNLFVTMSARMLNSQLRIVTKFSERGIEPKLRRAGADAVVSPNTIGGLRIASEMIRPSAVDFIDKMIRSAQGTVRIEEVPIKEGSSFEGKRISECAFSENYRLMVLAFQKNRGGGMDFNPPGSTLLEAGNVLIVMGDVEDVRRAVQA